MAVSLRFRGVDGRDIIQTEEIQGHRKPAQNAYIQRFNRTYREEVLDMHLFKNIADIQAITDKWMIEYNNERPQKSLGNLSPRRFIENKIMSTNGLY